MQDNADFKGRVDRFLFQLTKAEKDNTSAEKPDPESGPLQLDDDGMVSLGFPNGPVVVLQAYDDPPLLRLRADVERMPANQHAMMQKCLQMNLFEMPAVGLVLAYDADTDGIVLCQEIDAGMLQSSDDFVAALSGFVEALPVLRQKLDSHHGASSAAHPENPVFSDEMMIWRG